MTTFDFTGKVVAVSGAAIGFGRAMSKLFAADGAAVYGCDVLPAADDGAGLVVDRVDLTDRDAARRWIGTVEKRAGKAIDVLVCNAGGVCGQSHRPFETVTDSDWNQVVTVNLDSSFALCQAAVPAMKAAGRGSIVTITSGAALQASWTGVQAYCSAKHAVLGLTRQLAHEFGQHGIRVNSVAPGFVRTNAATERQWKAYGPERQRLLIDGIALRRLGAVHDIAQAVLFLASDAASYITGQILQVDGGR